MRSLGLPTHHSFFKYKHSQHGLSVVELLVSMLISLAVVAGAIEVIVGSKRSFLDQDEVSFIQTNARYALDVLAKDIRMAGYLGCAAQDSVQIANSLSDDAGGFISLHGLTGFDGASNTNSFPADFKSDALVGTDAFIVRRAKGEGEIDVSSHVAAAATIHLWQNHSYPEGSTLMIADANCRNVGLFQVSGPNGLPSNHINHNTGNGTSNCTKIIKGKFKCDGSCKTNSCGGYDHSTGDYGPGSKVMEFVSHAYYIGESSLIPGMPALKRKALKSMGAPATEEEEIALGVEDMEIFYGIDTNGNGSVDQYRDASEMDLNGNAIVEQEEWDRVSSVKVSLVFRSESPVLNKAEKRTLAGKEYEDRYLRQVVNSTVKIRNRG